MDDLGKKGRELFEGSVASLQAVLDEGYVDALGEAASAIARCFQAGGKLLVFGNGGSAADAQHISAEFVGRFKLERPALPAIALTANTSVLTAWSNDYDYETVFSRQVEAHGKKGDIAWGISTSGNSPNIVKALSKARELGLVTIGLSGNAGGGMSALCDINLTVKSKDTPRIQEAHLVGYHIICKLVEDTLYGAQ